MFTCILFFSFFLSKKCPFKPKRIISSQVKIASEFILRKDVDKT